MDEKLIEKIRQVGLSDKEARIYLFLAENGGAYPSTIALKTKINRSTVYKTLETLSIKGIVSEIQKGKKLFYCAEPPTKIKKNAEYQIEIAERAMNSAVKLIPDLDGLFNQQLGRPKVSFYEGKEGVVEAYLKHVEVDKPYKMVAFANVFELKKWLPEKKFQYYIRQKQLKGITARGITSTDPYSYEFLHETHKPIVSKKFFPELKRVPFEMFPFPAEITMFDTNKVSIVKFDEQNPIGVIIEDKIIHDMLYSIFEMVWISTDFINKNKQ